jgi:hypothetical protein
VYVCMGYRGMYVCLGDRVIEVYGMGYRVICACFYGLWGCGVAGLWLK